MMIYTIYSLLVSVVIGVDGYVLGGASIREGAIWFGIMILFLFVAIPVTDRVTKWTGR